MTVQVTEYSWGGGNNKPDCITKDKADAVGDIVLSDGTAVAASEACNMSASQKSKAVAVIFYVGNSNGILGAKTLGVGLQNSGENYFSWTKQSASGYNKTVNSIVCTPSQSGSDKSGAAKSATFTGDRDGSDNWTVLGAENEENYPAWKWVNNYAKKNSLSGIYRDGWYLPSVAELTVLYRAVKSDDSVINSMLKAAGGMEIGDRLYWSSSQTSSSEHIFAWSVWFNKAIISGLEKKQTLSVCAIRAF